MTPVWTLFDDKMRNPWMALAVDEAVCRHFSGKEFRAMVRIWRNPAAVCFGRTCEASKNAHASLIAGLNPGMGASHYKGYTTLLRRASGGGTVLHGPGNWNYSIIVSLGAFPSVYPVKQSYEIFLGLVSEALAEQGIEARQAGQSDLVFAQTESEGYRKFSGNAQFRKQGLCVHHGTLLQSLDLIRGISAALPHPPKEPEYRAGRSHDGFLGSLPEHFSALRFGEDLARKTSLWAETGTAPLPAEHRKKIFQLAGNLAKKIYTNREWILSGKSPE